MRRLRTKIVLMAMMTLVKLIAIFIIMTTPKKPCCNRGFTHICDHGIGLFDIYE
jgi:hypothetical protein